MILESVEHGPLIWPTVEENGVMRTKKYAELYAAEKIQADCDMKATNIILQGLPADIYSLVNHQRTEDLDTYDSGCDDLSNAQAVLKANISNYGFDIISVVANSNNYLNDMDNQKLLAEQAFWLRVSNPTIKSSLPPVRVEIPSELPKVCLVNESLKKLKFQLAQFDSMVRKRTTPNALTEGVKCSISASGSKPLDNTKNNRISQPSSNNKINKVEDQPRSVKTRKNKKNRVKKVKCDDHVMQSSSNANFVLVYINNAPVKISMNDVKFCCLCAICGKCMIAETYHECVQLVVQIVLWYLDSGCSKHLTWNRSQLMNFFSKFLGIVRFGNDQIARIMRYSDYQLGNVVISRDEAINTACYTQNCSLIRHRYNKTPYELMQYKKPNLSFLYVFGSLCYPINNHKDLGKIDVKADIGIFIGYMPIKKAFRIYNRRTQIISETILVRFDELIAMASEQFSSGLGLHVMTPAIPSTGLVSNPGSQQSCIPQNRDD
nr:retrovirus-related Pol polyprotein from transposon TNT 1-94 [Tanacetum cinerariifolium]